MDQLWTAEKVYTGRRRVEAIVVEDGRVVAAGSARSARRESPTGAERIRRPGRLVVPGWIDAHLHLTALARSRESVPLGDLSSRAGVTRRLTAWAAEHPDPVIVGVGGSIPAFGRGSLRRLDLDRAVRDRPVVLIDASGHQAMANRAALAALGVRSAGSGILGERSMATVYDWLEQVMPIRPEQYRRLLAELAARGLTTVASVQASARERAALRRSEPGRDGRPLPRVRCYAPISELATAARERKAGEASPGRVRLVGVKIFVDGAFGPRTAALREPYADRPDWRGELLWSDRALAAAIDHAHGAGLAVAMHAIGDRGVASALRALRRAGGPPAGVAPPRIEHAGLVPTDLVRRWRSVRAVGVVQPGFLETDQWLLRRLGRSRIRCAYPFRSLLRAGVVLAGSSDAPYGPVDPWRGIRLAMRRPEIDRIAPGLTVREGVSFVDAVRMYTHGGAAALGEPTLGSLEPGGVADLLVLGAASESAAARRPDSPVLETWIGGVRSVHHRRPTGRQAR